MVIRYVSAQPANEYYTWQVEVMINNFIKNGINPNNIDIICAINNGIIPEKWNKLANKYNYVRFFFYEDDRVNPCYISSIRPNILKKHFKQHSYLSNDAIFYHDCDMIFTKPVNWSSFLQDDVWYCSDARFYVGADYIKSKKFGIYEDMCKIIGIPDNIPSDNELNSGGAQYIMKNIDYKFWEKVESDSEKLYAYFLDHLNRHPETPDYHPIQKWTADMWAVLWNAWYYNHEVKVVPEMEFAWATQGKDMWEKCTIYHNAGVCDQDKHVYFYKADYINTLPYDLKNYVDPSLASHYYLNEILTTGKKSCLI